MNRYLGGLISLFLGFWLNNSHAQTVFEQFNLYQNITSNWISSLEKLNDSTYLFLENTTTNQGSGLQLINKLYKMNGKWEKQDSVSFSLVNVLVIVDSGFIFLAGRPTNNTNRQVELFVLNAEFGIVNQQLLNGDIQDLDAIRIRKIPNGVGVLAYDGSNFNSYLFEIRNSGQSITKKQFSEGNRAIRFVDDICYMPSINKYVFSGGLMRSDTLKAGADYVMALGSCDLNLSVDSIRFTSFYPTSGSPLKRAAVINERPSSLIRINDSSFYLFANGKDFPHILHNPFRVDQISVSRWSGDLTLLTHEMYGRSDSADLMLYGNVSKDFEGNIWLGFVSENPIGSEWHYSRGEIGFMKFNGTGGKLDEFYIQKTDMRLTPRTVMCFADSNILVGGSYYDFNGNRPLRSMDAFLMVVNPFRLWSSTKYLGENQLKVSVYPNPSEGLVNFELSEEISSIQIRDIQGRLLQKSVTKKVDLSGVPQGIYLYELLTQSGKIRTGKLIRR